MRRWFQFLAQVAHVKLCWRCRQVAEQAVRDLARERAELRLLRQEMRRQKARAFQDCDDLLSNSPEDQFLIVERSRSVYRSRPVVEELLQRSHREIHENPQESLHLARLAEAVADGPPQCSVGKSMGSATGKALGFSNL